MRKLLAAKALVDMKDNFGLTPLSYACQMGSCLVVNALLEWNADANTKNDWGATPLHHATSHNQCSVVPILLEGGANINAVTRSGLSVTSIAIVYHRHVLLEFLLARSDLNIRLKEMLSVLRVTTI